MSVYAEKNTLWTISLKRISNFGWWSLTLYIWKEYII